MSERRRSLLVLLLVLGLHRRVALRSVTTRTTKLGLDLKGGVQLDLPGPADGPAADGHPGGARALAGHHARARRRVRRRRARAAAAPARTRSRSTSRAWTTPSAPPTGRIDRPAVLLRLGSQHPRRGLPDGPGREPNGRQAVTGFYRGGQQAAKCDAQADGNNNAADAPRFYAFNKTTNQPLNSGAAGGAAAKPRSTDLSREARANAEVIEVPEGILVVARPEAERRRARARPLLGHPGQPGALGHGHQEPQAELRRDAPAGRHLRLHGQGAQGVPAHHRRDRPARRRQRAAERQPDDASQHFAIVLDDELISAPYINYQENPDGIDGSTGAQISGSFTIPRRRTSRGSSRSARCRSASSSSRARRSRPRSAPRRSTRAWSRALRASRSSPSS